MQLVTITPIRSHLNLRQGVNERSADYSRFLSQLEIELRAKLIPEDGSTKHQVRVQDYRQGKAYTDTGGDDRDTLCLFTHKKTVEEGGHEFALEAKVFSNTLSVVVLTLELDHVVATLNEIVQALSLSVPQAHEGCLKATIDSLCNAIAKAPRNESAHELLKDIYQLIGEDDQFNLELFAQAKSSFLISAYYKRELFPALKNLASAVKVNYLEPIDDFSGFNDISASDSEVNQSWSARLLRLSRNERVEHATLIKSWLAETPHPEHADEIINADRMDSMVWLNYVLVDSVKPCGEIEWQKSNYKLEAMCLAQYFYAVQHACNSNLYMAISDTYLESNTHVAEDILAGVRATTRMHISDYHENCQYLQREKKALLERILAGWDYDEMIQNSERLIEICSSKIKDIHASRSEKSSFYTDLILVAIGFISLFDLAITISEYSRTYTSNAALGYRDEQPSSFLSSVANMETDLLLSSSVFTIILLFVVYYVAKRR